MGSILSNEIFGIALSMPFEVIAVNDERNNGGLSALEEPAYTPKPKENALAGVSAAALAEDDFVDTRSSALKNGPTGVAAPTLADDNFVDTRKNRSLEGVAAPTLADDSYVDTRKTAPQPPPASATAPAFVPQPLNEQQIAALNQRRAEAGQPPYTQEQLAAIQQAYLQKQLAAYEAQQTHTSAPAAPVAPAAPPVQAPVLEEPTYVPPPKKEPAAPAPSAAQAAALLEEPAEPERRVSRYNDEDIAAAKAGAQRRAAESTLNQPVEINKEESRRLMNELRMEREAALAKKGFKVVLILMLVGLCAAGALFAFSRRKFSPDMTSGFYQTLTDATIYISSGLGLVSVLLLFRVEAIKKLASFLFGLTAFCTLMPGVLILTQKSKAGMALTALFYLLSLGLSFAECFLLSTNEAVNMYYKRRENDNFF